MKSNILCLTIIILIAGIVSISCCSAVKKDIKLAKEKNKEINTLLNQTRKDSKEEIKVKVDWKKFNKDSQTAIKDREIQFEELRGEISELNKEEQQKFTSELNTLEQKNKSLKERLVQINNKFKANMEQINESQEVIKIAFENAFVKDMNVLIAGIIDFWENK